MLTNAQFTACVQRYLDTVYRVALNYIRSASDAEDVAQNVFIKLLQTHKRFESDAHMRNWLIRVTINECKNLVRSKRWKEEPLDTRISQLSFESPEQSDLFYSVMELPTKYRVPIYLFYYEDYSTQEIAQMLKIPKATVCTQLRRGRDLLRAAMTEVEDYV